MDIPIGSTPDIAGKPIVNSCVNCQHCIDDSDGYEYGPAFYVCAKKQNMQNLKGFPFKTPQKCFEIHYVYLVDWDEEAKRLGYKS